LSRQAWLFAPSSPLARNLAGDAFRSLPRAPGVYRFLDSDGRTLYVGKAKDLRARVGSYRRAAPGRASRKTVRLVARVRAIEWEVCSGEREALLRENELLRRMAPPFNVQKTRPQFYGFVGVRADEDSVRLRVSSSADPQGDTVFGAFKGLGSLRAVCQALARLSWLAGSGSAAPLPAALVREPRASIPLAPAWPPSAVRRFFAGTSDAVLDRAAATLGARTLVGFDSAVAATDLERLRDFFDRQARRGLELRRRHGLRRWIRQSQLDDLLVLSPRAV
jgi:hypothetical protein